jgi:hypothetical protein
MKVEGFYQEKKLVKLIEKLMKLVYEEPEMFFKNHKESYILNDKCMVYLRTSDLYELLWLRLPPLEVLSSSYCPSFLEFSLINLIPTPRIKPAKARIKTPIARSTRINISFSLF